MLYIIAAVAENGVIGRKNGLPFDLPADRTWFKEQTGSLPVVMGLNTYKSLPEKFRPLPGRENIVLTQETDSFSEPRVTIAHDFNTILERAKTEDVFVIGGGQIYRLALPYADKMYITRVHVTVEGDVTFPEWDAKDWTLISSTDHPKDEKNEFGFTWEIYSRRHTYIEMANCRTEDQRRVMREILEKNHCPFCPEQLPLYHKKPILWTGEHWVVSENMWPYPGSKIHLILILKKHAERIEDVPQGAFEEMGTIMKWATETYEIEGGGFYMRFGECLWTGGTVRHIHAHIASKSNVGDEAIKFYLG